jgi:hypothetical protein
MHEFEQETYKFAVEQIRLVFKREVGRALLQKFKDSFKLDDN